MKTGFRLCGHSPNYQLLKEYAIRMRKNPTECERLMWQVLRGNRLGVKFRRQHIIGDYIADFACVSAGIVIEVDGGYHNNAEQKQEDEIRTNFLNERGFKVIRFTNEQVLNNLDYVISTIKQELT